MQVIGKLMSTLEYLEARNSGVGVRFSAATTGERINEYL